MCVNTTGFGTTISQAGLPRAGASVASADACGGLPEWEVLYSVRLGALFSCTLLVPSVMCSSRSCYVLYCTSLVVFRY